MRPDVGDLRPGDLMFGPIGGLVPGVFPVGLGQLLLAASPDRATWRSWWRIRHVGVVVSGLAVDPVTSTELPHIVQAMPRGAEEVELQPHKHWTRDYIYVRPNYQTADPTFEMDMPGHPYAVGQAQVVAEAARGYVGTPYNFLTYAKLAAAHFHLPISTRILRKWISTRKDMMCSQLADQALADAGYHVFDDGRLPQDVVPAELYRALVLKPGTQWIRPGDGEWNR